MSKRPVTITGVGGRIVTVRRPIACGVDVGSTNIKVVAIDASGAVAARAARPTPRDAPTAAVKATMLLAALADMVEEVCGDHFEVHAVSCAGIGEDGVLVDAGLRPITSALAWFDPRRAAAFADLAVDRLRDRDFDVPTDPVCTMVGWHWARRHAHGAPAEAWIALTDLPSVVWSEARFLSDSLASRTAAWSVRDRRWDPDRVGATLGDVALLPPVVEAGRVIGELRSPRLRGAGIVAADAVIVAGGHDHPVAAYAARMIDPGAVLDSMGTAEVVVGHTAASLVPRHDEIDIAPGIHDPGTTLLRIEELARNVQWASRDPAVAVQIHEQLLGAVDPPLVFMDGYFIPGSRGGGLPHWSRDAPHDPAARAAAVLGALASAGNRAVAAIRGDTSADAPVRLAGGWVRSPGWLAIKAAVSDFRATPILEPEVTAVGAALLAARARGWRPDASRALSGFVAGMLG